MAGGLEYIQLKNFQKHKNMRIDFDPHITTICGATDSGKSSILRALWWHLSGRPSRNNFIHHGKKNCRTKIQMDGHATIRIKGPTNIYKTENQTYKAFKKEVPDDIKNIFNIDEVNFQSQHDSPYWFSCTSGEVSRQLNRIVDLGSIDTALTNIGSMVRRAKSEVEVSENRLDDAKKERTRLRYALELDKNFQNLEKSSNRYERMRSKVESLKEIVIQIEKDSFKINTTDEQLSELKKVMDIGETWKEYLLIKQSLEKYVNTINLLEKKTKIASPKISRLKKMSSELNEIMQKKDQLRTKIDEITNMEISLCQDQKKLKDLEKEAGKWKGRICPLCRNTIV